MESMDGSLVLMMERADFTTLCSILRSGAEQLLYQAVMHPDRLFSLMYLLVCPKQLSCLHRLKWSHPQTVTSGNEFFKFRVTECPSTDRDQKQDQRISRDILSLRHLLCGDHVPGDSCNLFLRCYCSSKVARDDGRQWLIHKGRGYGISSDTVVTDAAHMSDRWKVTDERAVEGRTVGDFVETGGQNYDLLTDNCHHASSRMMCQ
ncbi:uncharacterized protein LOC132209607 [Stegostoma tigrinum]|uniref:uncharacterized protein LOC132209607 n=1 Tax=Stegostoma tigrinum TaxID=3053191 RepID=UPI00286FB6B2|nr:uncharacterized protein LOC132209607 [Stegostoma tigrinum]